MIWYHWYGEFHLIWRISFLWHQHEPNQAVSRAYHCPGRRVMKRMREMNQISFQKTLANMQAKIFKLEGRITRTVHVVYLPTMQYELWKRSQRQRVAPICMESKIWEHFTCGGKGHFEVKSDWLWLVQSVALVLIVFLSSWYEMHDVNVIWVLMIKSEFVFFNSMFCGNKKSAFFCNLKRSDLHLFFHINRIFNWNTCIHYIQFVSDIFHLLQL